jgi:hypothetical protein
MSSAVLRSRYKKYDSYENRGRVFAGNVDSLTSPTLNKAHNRMHALQTKSSVHIKQDATRQHQPDKYQLFTGLYIPQEPTGLTVPTKANQSKSQIGVPKATHLLNTLPDKLALQVIANSKASEDEKYPDYDTTVYRSVKQQLSKLQKSMYAFGVIVLVFSAFVSVQSFLTNKEAKEQIATLGENSSRDEQGVEEGTGNEPSEVDIPRSVISAYQVSNPLDPRYLRIPELGVFARVKNMGATSDGAVDSPKNVHDVGWYNGSTRPGNTAGASLLIGHVSGWTSQGVFKEIRRLVPGSQFEVERGNGEIIRYSVTRTEKMALKDVDMSKILSTEVASQHDVKLMTCAGRYNKDTRTYEDRFVVYAEQKK